LYPEQDTDDFGMAETERFDERGELAGCVLKLCAPVGDRIRAVFPSAVTAHSKGGLVSTSRLSARQLRGSVISDRRNCNLKHLYLLVSLNLSSKSVK
jgi:hypothetical protein